jgi:hypothetical protein
MRPLNLNFDELLERIRDIRMDLENFPRIGNHEEKLYSTRY